MALTLTEASHEARTMTWAGTTRSVNIATMRNGIERVYAFNRDGMVVGRILDGELFTFEEPWMP